MKKPLAIILLIAGALIVISALGFLNLVLILELSYGGLFIGIAIALAAGFGVNCLRQLFREKYKIKLPKFFLCAYLPSFVSAAVYTGIVLYLDEIGYFKGFLGGLGELLFGITWGVTVAAIAIAGVVWLPIYYNFINKKAQEP